MALILNIETSTKSCSSAIYDNDTCVAHDFFVGDGYVHAERLNPTIDKLFRESGRKMSELDAIAVSKGPGSYTGLRIGVSSAKGFCFALDIPLIAIDTLELMALKMKQEIKTEVGVMVPMIDARRMEVYCAQFSNTCERLTETEAKIMDEFSFQEELKSKKILFAGDGSEKIKSLFASHSNALFLNDVYPDAKYMGTLAHQKFLNGSFENLAYFEPFYLKDFLATVPKKLI